MSKTCYRTSKPLGPSVTQNNCSSSLSFPHWCVPRLFTQKEKETERDREDLTGADKPPGFCFPKTEISHQSAGLLDPSFALKLNGMEFIRTLRWYKLKMKDRRLQRTDGGMDGGHGEAGGQERRKRRKTAQWQKDAVFILIPDSDLVVFCKIKM